MDDELGATHQSVVGDRVHVTDDEVGPVPGFEQGVGTTVHGHHERFELPDVGPQRGQVLAVVLTAHHDEHVPASRRVRSCGVTMPSTRSPPSLVMYSSVLATKACSWAAAPALASAMAACTVSAVCRRPLAISSSPA